MRRPSSSERIENGSDIVRIYQFGLPVGSVVLVDHGGIDVALLDGGNILQYLLVLGEGGFALGISHHIDEHVFGTALRDLLGGCVVRVSPVHILHNIRSACIVQWCVVPSGAKESALHEVEHASDIAALVGIRCLAETVEFGKESVLPFDQLLRSLVDPENFAHELYVTVELLVVEIYVSCRSNGNHGYGGVRLQDVGNGRIRGGGEYHIRSCLDDVAIVVLGTDIRDGADVVRNPVSGHFVVGRHAFGSGIIAVDAYYPVVDSQIAGQPDCACG